MSFATRMISRPSGYSAVSSRTRQHTMPTSFIPGARSTSIKVPAGPPCASPPGASRTSSTTLPRPWFARSASTLAKISGKSYAYVLLRFWQIMRLR